MLTGQNGILKRAAEAKETTENAQTEELVKASVLDALTDGTGKITDINLKKALNNNLGTEKYEVTGDEIIGWTIKANGKEYKVDSTEKGEGTTPYLPNETFTKKEGDLSTGLVIKDSNDNEYVWVEVPTTIYTNSEYNANGTPDSGDDWEKIRDCLKAYAADYSNSYYTDTDGTIYSDDYKNMLKSVYTNGGFWIGRYEAGFEGEMPRTSHTNLSESDKAVVKPNMYPYNWVTRDEAQTLAERMKYSGVTSSLIYGVQWDLMLKYIESKGATTKSNLKTDSTTIGNYENNLWNITNTKAKYSTDDGKKFTVCPYEKKSNAEVLLTTGADGKFSLMNIYDVAGNVSEWTREFASISVPCVYRGGYYGGSGSSYPAKYRTSHSTSYSDFYIGFRFGLWK